MYISGIEIIDGTIREITSPKVTVMLNEMESRSKSNILHIILGAVIMSSK